MNTCELPATQSAVALKEWAATIEALRQGRQIMLLRKGGLHDAGGVFELEHQQFWLFPTQLHQATTLVKPEHRDLLQSTSHIDKQHIEIQCFARVERVWRLDETAQSTLQQTQHIWSPDYLTLRFGYQPGHTLAVMALRVWQLPQAQVVAPDAKYFGCRSWVELAQPLALEDARPVLSDAEFAAHFEPLTRFGL